MELLLHPSDPAPSPRVLPILQAILGLIALAAIIAPLALVLTTPRVVQHKRPHVVISNRVVPKTEIPAVEPVRIQEVAPADAKSINDAIPFSTLPNPAARAFRLFGSLESQARAVDCLAAAVFYEAGDDAVGQRAVAQVIINRMRHPAFPKTICGVVFQGQERSTGCQFTFTCDGAMVRWAPRPAAWERARGVARMALYGSVYAPVGHATHYHTDWVVPYWSASLEKITEVHTHLFFRWAGWWGTPPAFSRGYAGVEPNVPKLSRLSPAHFGDPDALPATDLPTGSEGAMIDPATIPASAVPAPMTVESGGTAEGNNFMLTLPKGMGTDAFAALAIRTCGERHYCKFMAWTDPKQTPSALPLSSAQVSTMSFSYLRDQSQGFAKALWNCQQFKRPSPVQCMRAQPPVAGAIVAPATAVDAKLPPPLAGVRKKEPVTEATKPQATLTLPGPRPSPTPRPTPIAPAVKQPD
ncbi:cell wall hydrolase [Sphingomonas soli]|uniref:cell wall hydrolase n=1 Tax=Sphingomonas soli TaxID=266127 RepID=UPI0009FC1A58|nr:cell wall hydrolase [Sphingomonas soli]